MPAEGKILDRLVRESSLRKYLKEVRELVVDKVGRAWGAVPGGSVSARALMWSWRYRQRKEAGAEQRWGGSRRGGL